MFEHLISASEAEFVPVITPTPTSGFTEGNEAAPSDEIDAKFGTAQWLEALGAVTQDEISDKTERAVAQTAFAALTVSHDLEKQKEALARVQTPEAVKHLVGMLTAYDWQFVEQAQEIRGYAVAKLVEETSHPDAKIRLKALELLGRVTEIGLFTERIEIKQTSLSDAEIDRQIEERLGKLIGDAVIVDNEPQTPEKSDAGDPA